MKKLLFFVAGALMICSAMTSCLSADDDNSSSYHTLTAAERSAITQKIYQSYTGCVKFYNDSSKMDSIASSLSFTSDSTAVLSYPVALLANYVTGSKLDSARTALLNAPAQTLLCYVYPPYMVDTDRWSYYQKGIYLDITFFPYPQTFQFATGGHTYELTFSYTTLSYLYSPVMQYQNGKVYAFVLLSGLKVDDSYSFSINMPTEFVGKAE